MSRREAFAAGLRTSRPLTGLFVKTPAYHNVELLAQTDLDFLVIDAEHAPFDPSQIDMCALAGQAKDMPLLVRVGRNEPDAILSVLDVGAAGVFVPHVRSATDARKAAQAAKYIGGSRGFSPSTRAGGYGSRGLRDYMIAADQETALVLQIEDAEALDHLEAIAQTPGVSGLFVGRADLAASMGADWNDPRLDEATRQTALAAHAAGISCGAYLADPDQAETYRAWGVSFFVTGSDQSALKTEAQRIANAFTPKPA